jgi:hypothetical protein
LGARVHTKLAAVGETQTIALAGFLLRVSAAIIALLAVIGALALLVLGSAAIIRKVIPEPDAEPATVFSSWMASLTATAISCRSALRL